MMPHMYDGWWFFGMHMVWWFFWILLLVMFFWWLRLVPRGSAQTRRETPLEILQHRYAAGEITSEEYEECKARLERDRQM